MIPGRSQPSRLRHGATGVCDKAEKSGSQLQQHTMKKLIITAVALAAITGAVFAAMKCTSCNGTGWIGNSTCMRCKGTGQWPAPQ